MPNEGLLKAITNQGEKLVERAKSFQSLIDKQVEVIQAAQRTIDNCMSEMKATNLQIDALRAEYRRLVANSDESRIDE